VSGLLRRILSERPLAKKLRGQEEVTEWENVVTVIFYQGEKTVELEISGVYEHVLIDDVEFLTTQELHIGSEGVYTSPREPQPCVEIHSKYPGTFRAEYIPYEKKVLVY